MYDSSETIKTEYLGAIFRTNRFKKTVKECLLLAEELRSKYKYDSIAFSGTSGSAIAYILSYEMSIPLICIRKKTDKAHYSYGDFEGNLGVKKYIIVDDFISSGETVDRILSSIQQRCFGAECVAMIMYTQSAGKIQRHRSVHTPSDGITVYASSYHNFQMHLF